MKERFSGFKSRYNIRGNKLRNFTAAGLIFSGAAMGGAAQAEGYDPIGFNSGSESGHTVMQEEEEKTIIPGIAKDGKADPPPPTATPTPEPTPSQAQEPESEPLYVHPEPNGSPHPPGARYLHPQNPEIYSGLLEKYFGEKAEEAEDIMLCESQADLFATGHAGEHGLFQIHPVHDEKFEGRNKYDPEVNAEVALEVYREAGNSWSPWTTETVLYNGGYCPNGVHVSEFKSLPMPNE